MKPSHLAALCLAVLGVGGMSAAATQTPKLTQELRPLPGGKAARLEVQRAVEIACRYDMERGGIPITSHPVSWRKLNQRQLRRNRRRANAAGIRNAFA